MSPFILSSKDDRLRVRLWTGSDAVIDHTAQHSTGRLGVCLLLVGLALLVSACCCRAQCRLLLLELQLPIRSGVWRCPPCCEKTEQHTHRHRQPSAFQNSQEAGVRTAHVDTDSSTAASGRQHST